MAQRLGELVALVGRGWFALVPGTCFGIYGAVELISASNETGWFWIAAGLAAFIVVALVVAYRALSQRDEAKERAERVESEPRQVIGYKSTADAPGAIGTRVGLGGKVFGIAHVGEQQDDEEDEEGDLPSPVAQ
jgi:membrane protein implicated in regulation of membrane protease activity